MACRLLELAPNYFDLKDLKDGETKRALIRVQTKQQKKRSGYGAIEEGRTSKKIRK